MNIITRHVGVHEDSKKAQKCIVLTNLHNVGGIMIFMRYS